MLGSTYAPTHLAAFTSAALKFKATGVSGTATHGATTNIDYKLVDDMLITGGAFLTQGAAFGDTVSIQVVDVDNMLGYGAGLVLNQFVVNWVCFDDMPGTRVQAILDVPYPGKVLGGLYLRIAYTSVGSTDVQVAMNYLLHLVGF